MPSALLPIFQQGIISKKSYIRMEVTNLRHSLGNNFNVALPIEGIENGETLQEISTLINGEFISVTIPSTLTISWMEPQLLPGYTPTQVLQMRVAGQGFLYFALGAENPTKTATQTIAIARLIDFYKIGTAGILFQLGLLLQANACAVTLPSLSISWLDKLTDSSPSFNIASHEASTNHPLASSASKGFLSPEDFSKIANLGSFATKSTLIETDIPVIPSTKVTGLGSLATKSTLVETDIPTIAIAKVTNLSSSLTAKQDVLTPTSTILIASIATTTTFAITAIAQSVTNTSTISPNRELIQISSTAALEITTAVPITPGTEGQNLTIVNSGNFSIYLKILQFGLRPKTSTRLIFLNNAWVILNSAIPGINLGRNQEFNFYNGAKIAINDDYSFFIFNSAGTNQSQESGVSGCKVHPERGIISRDNNTWNRPAGYYKYNLGLNNIVLPGVLTTEVEYKCF